MKYIVLFIILVLSALVGLGFHYRNDINPTQIPKSVIVYQSEVDNDDDDDLFPSEQAIYAH